MKDESGVVPDNPRTLRKETTMARRIVGWLLSDQGLCEICQQKLATVIVSETEIDPFCGEYERDFQACDACVPAGSCPDPIADVFVKLAEQIKAGKNYLVDSDGNLRPKIARQVGVPPLSA